MIFFAVFLCHIEPTCQKLCFYNQNCEFLPLGPLVLLLKGPPNSSKTDIFKKNVFCFTLNVTLMSPKLRLLALKGPSGPKGPLLKGPLTHQKRIFSKITISSVLLCHTEPTYQKLCFYHQNCCF